MADDPRSRLLTHPLYDRWAPTWRLLGEVYEGDGGFQDGSHLIPYPRELEYEIDVNGYETTTVLRERPKFQRRKRLAHYQNYAQVIADTVIDYQFAQDISRSVGSKADDSEITPYEAWLEDVDGHGTHLDDWLEQHERLAAVYGHVWVVMDRAKTEVEVKSKADQAAPILRAYIPLDALDWIADGRTVREIKFVEAAPRTSLKDAAPVLDTAALTGEALDSGADVRLLIWTETEWRIENVKGEVLERGKHGMGACPVTVLYWRPRARVPFVGRSLLGDPRIYRDHFNQYSEYRELQRSQTFAIFNVVMRDDEKMEDAAARLPAAAGPESLVFTYEPVQFAAPPDGPLASYVEGLATLERKMFRLTRLPWETDSRDAESAESRARKARDLNRLLSSAADKLEELDYWIAEQFFIATDGPEQGEANYDRAEIRIKHPDNFDTKELLDELTEAQLALTLPFPKAAKVEIVRRLVPTTLPDLPPAIRTEIDAAVNDIDPDAVAADKAQAFSDRLRGAMDAGAQDAQPNAADEPQAG